MLEKYVWQAIHSDYLLGILVTSQAQASVPSEGWSFGAGKTTWALSFAKTFIFGGDFKLVKKHLIGFAHELSPFLEPPLTPGVIWDDMQLAVGKHRAHDMEVRKLAYFFTTQRPHLSVLIGTAPHRGILQKDFREEIFHFEVIVPARGVYEVQQLKRWIPFRDPLNIKERLEPAGKMAFLSLTREEQEWYNGWREWRDKEAKKRIKLLQPPKDDDEMVKHVTSDDFYYRARELGIKGSRSRFHELWRTMNSE